MSKRREAGDVVLKMEHAGFVGEAGRILLHHQDGGIDVCFMECGDDNCKEWANCEFLDEQGIPTGRFAYHVSECQMKDA